MRIRSVFCLAIVCVFVVAISSATSIKSVKLDDLFLESDVVAYVKVVAADSESYDNGGIVKADVLEAFKGCVVGQAIYFSSASYEPTNEYLAFLKDTKTSLIQHQKAGNNKCLGVFESSAAFLSSLYAGYSVMEIGYSDKLGDWEYVVAFSERQIILPKIFKTATVDDWNRATDKVLASKMIVGDYLRKLNNK